MTRIFLLLVCGVLATPSWAAAHDTANSESAGIGRVVKAVCTKDVVMLGEDNHHASGATLRVKVKLVKRLVEQCGFHGVVFESQFYDMLDFENAIHSGTASRKQLADAIGAVWSRYAQFAPLVGWLYDEAKAGRVRIGGMDPQAGGITGYFSLQKLPGVLSAVLKGQRRVDCESAIRRQNNWGYDKAHPFDAAALRRLRGCVRDIQGRLRAVGGHTSPELGAMVNSYTAYLGFAGGNNGGNRDLAMYRNFQWLRKHWPKGTRIVVWCATVHAAKSSNGWDTSFRTFGSYVHERFGSHAAAIGFSALGGTYGNVGGHGRPHVIPHAQAGSLEARAFEGPGPHAMRFLDREQLHAMGKMSSRALTYAKPYTLDWAHVLDGIIVLRREKAARAAH